MATTRITTKASQGAVFAVLADPWRYSDWVVGAKRIRKADPTWPAVGSTFAHALGAGPAEVKDTTTVEQCDAPVRIVLRARFRPAGEARVELRLESGGGRTRITMMEHPIAGPIHKLRGRVLDAATHVRNKVALRRLRRIAERTAFVADQS